MDQLTDAVRDLRARPITFELPDGTQVEIEPPSLAQVSKCLRLDPKPGQTETAAERVIRFARQAEIILGPSHAHLVHELQQRQVAEIVGALYVATSGLDPVSYVRWQQQQMQTAGVLSALELLRNLDRLIMDLSASLQKMPADVGALPLADAVALRERVDVLAKAKANLQASIAGVKLTWEH